MISVFESTASGIFDLAVNVSMGMLLISLALTFLRLLLGPSLADRVVALDTLVLIGIVFTAVFSLATTRYVYLDIGIALGLVGFLATVAFARYIERRGPVTPEAKHGRDH